MIGHLRRKVKKAFKTLTDDPHRKDLYKDIFALQLHDRALAEGGALPTQEEIDRQWEIHEKLPTTRLSYPRKPPPSSIPSNPKIPNHAHGIDFKLLPPAMIRACMDIYAKRKLALTKLALGGCSKRVLRKKRKIIRQIESELLPYAEHCSKELALRNARRNGDNPA